MEQIDPGQLMAELQPGTAIYALTKNHQNIPHVDFLIRENSFIIGKLHNPRIETRAGVVTKGNVALVVVMFALWPFMERIYETWWNYYAQDLGKRAFELMTIQGSFCFHMFGDSLQMEYSTRTNNGLQDFFWQAIRQTMAKPPWSMEAFDRAKDATHNNYPTQRSLWDALSAPSETECHGAN